MRERIPPELDGAVEPRIRFKSSADRLTEEEQDRAAWRGRVIPYQVPFLDDITRGILPTDLILLGARTGAGKTALASAIAQGAAEAGRRVHYLALEADRGELERRIRYRHVADLAGPRFGALNYPDWVLGKYGDGLREAEVAAVPEIAERLQTHHTLYRASEDFGVADLVETLRSVREKSDLVVVDHLHYIDHEDRDEQRGLKEATKAIRDAALSMGVPMLVVAHLRKQDRGRKVLVPELDDFHGSSDIVKIATRVIVLAPAWDEEAQSPGHSPTYCAVRKDRLVGGSNYAAVLQFNRRTWRYSDRYQLGRLCLGSEKWEELSDAEVGSLSWAKHEDRR